MAVVTIDGTDYRVGDDGVTHLNVYSQASTELGRWLSNFTRTELDLPEGQFVSLEGYYHYLKIQQALTEHGHVPNNMLQRRIERLKQLTGKVAQTWGRDVKQQLLQLGLRTPNRPSDDTNRAFEAALLQKLERNPEMAERLSLVLEDGVPLVHYYVLPDGTAFYKKRFDWLCERIYAVL
jgi:hypothetical protein